jgi:hypothetical protein
MIYIDITMIYIDITWSPSAPWFSNDHRKPLISVGWNKPVLCGLTQWEPNGSIYHQLTGIERAWNLSPTLC